MCGGFWNLIKRQNRSYSGEAGLLKLDHTAAPPGESEPRKGVQAGRRRLKQTSETEAAHRPLQLYIHRSPSWDVHTDSTQRRDGGMEGEEHR